MDDYSKILEKLNKMDSSWMGKISDLAMKTNTVETKLDMLLEVDKDLERVRDIACNARETANDAQKRLNKLDTWTLLIGSTVVIAIIGAVVKLIVI